MSKSSFLPVFLANIFISLHYAAVLYVNSTFLSRFFGSEEIGLLFVSAAVLNVILLFLVPRLAQRLGLKPLYFLFLIIVCISILDLAFAATAFRAALSFVLYAGTLFMVYYCLDIFLEELSVERRTGGTRGLYLTLSSAAFVAGPLILAVFSEGEELVPVYLAATALLLPAFLLGFILPKISHQSRGRLFGQTYLPLRAWWRATTVRRATTARFALEVFYAFMVIFVPIYLHTRIGFDWSELGVMFSIMLLPFVLFEWPMGKLADNRFGEKEIMTVGFFIIGAALLVMPYIGATFAQWALLLFISRIGASFVEISTESHFFRHVDARDSALISIFRLSRPVGLIVGSMLGAATLALTSFPAMFFVVAMVVFLGLRDSLYIKDTL